MRLMLGPAASFPYGRHNARPVEYFLLVEPQADGPVIGAYRDQPIADAVIDAYGERYAYAGIAPRLANGAYDVEALKPGEWLVEPGLVYVGDGAKTAPRRR